MQQTPDLTYAISPETSSSSGLFQRAIDVAARVLQQGGGAHFRLLLDHTQEWRDFYVFRYVRDGRPSLAHGGGSVLVVRKSDGLGGFVYCPCDWLDPPDADELCAPIPVAFARYDASCPPSDL